MTHFFNDIPYNIEGQYVILAKLELNENVMTKSIASYEDALILLNLQTFTLETKICEKKEK